MKVTLWGTRGSIAAPGIENARYGGNTSCVEVRGDGGTLVVLDAGTGLRRLGVGLVRSFARIDLLLTHLHMDHIQGLGFFGPLFDPEVEVHVWGPATQTTPLRRRLYVVSDEPLAGGLPVPVATVFVHELVHALQGAHSPLLDVLKMGAGRIEISPHNPSGPISTAASLHAAAVYPELVRSLEYSFQRQPSRSRRAPIVAM